MKIKLVKCIKEERHLEYDVNLEDFIKWIHEDEDYFNKFIFDKDPLKMRDNLRNQFIDYLEEEIPIKKEYSHWDDPTYTSDPCDISLILKKLNDNRAS